ncbi:Mpo1-like protein [uncultured Ferrimonas sp.]|uniref:Mpo1 family 2-hydroxy fatty acid dioxygenase n=1 Tax=uncultured Ferrimonas sp. TaxID=432640 RepID=UPI0026369C02|nr:Mpo1-like protein [uncultured Ferrimonas sp.]
MFNKSIQQWLDTYGVSHQNPTNKAIHWICVPVIVWTVLALLWGLQLPMQPLVNGATVLMVISLLFYWKLSPPLALGMVLFSALNLWLMQLHVTHLAWPLWQTALVLFVVAWIGQFIGHVIEGAKPSFFEDVQFLLIGPIWLLSFLYQKLGINYLPRNTAKP